ncbi:MAG: 30S ribosomal protein S20 [bacterium]
MAKKSISVKKRMRQSEKRRQINRIRKASIKKAIKGLMSTKTKKTAQPLYLKAQKLIDKSTQKGIIHKNKAAKLKSRLALHVAKLK